MVAIKRTVYPRLAHSPCAYQLSELFTPTSDDLAFARTTTRGPSALLSLLVLLKTFQRLGYFQKLNEVPAAIISHILTCAGLSVMVHPQISSRTLYKYHQAIRLFLEVKPFGAEAQNVLTDEITNAAQAKDNPADLINIGIEVLIKERFELPGYTTLEELVIRIRTHVNMGFFSLVASRLTQTEQIQLDQLLTTHLSNERTAYNGLKQLPKRPSLMHLQDLIVHLTWLLTLPDAERLLVNILHTKLIHFASEAKALDAAELQDVAIPKRYTLVLALIRQAQRQTRDRLVEMFLKRIATIHKRASEELKQIQLSQQKTTENLVSVFAQVLRTVSDTSTDAEAGARIQGVLSPAGGVQKLLNDCEQVSHYSGNNYLPLVWKHFRSHRSTLMQLLRALQLGSTTSEQSLMQAITYLKAHDNRRAETLPAEVALDFAPQAWQRLVRISQGQADVFSRRHFEACIFSCLASELKSGDLYVEGSEAYADYRAQLLSWEECEPLVPEYCAQIGVPSTAQAFVADLRQQLRKTAEWVDQTYPGNSSVVIESNGEPVLKKSKAVPSPSSCQALEALVHKQLSEQNLLDILINVDYWLGFTRHFGPFSGSDPKLENPQPKYLLTSFCYGTNLGPSQAARHLQGAVSAHSLSYINRRHISRDKLQAALTDIINRYNQLSLPRIWGTGSVAAADGTHITLAEDNPFAEYHIRYGSYGGIAYHHVSDTYIALFSHFIPCGVWEAVYILEGLLKNKSDIKPDTLHADTQGQSTSVFALAICSESS